MFKVHYRYRETIYHITVQQVLTVSSETSIDVDGVMQQDSAIPLIDDHQEHLVKVMIQGGQKHSLRSSSILDKAEWIHYD
jgi:hypothetical protein